MRMLLTLIILALGFTPEVYAQSALAQQVQDHFQIYIINKERRTQGDRSIIKKQKSGAQHAIMYYWRNLDNRNPADVICDAYQWLLNGRTRYGKGARVGFSKFSSVDAFELRFFDLTFSTKRGKRKGTILPTHKAKEYMHVRISRQDMKKNNFRQAWIDQQIKDDQCQNLKQLFSRVWFDKEYMRKKS